MNVIDKEIFESKSFQRFNKIDSFMIFISMFMIILFSKDFLYERLELSIQGLINGIFAYANNVFYIPVDYKEGININDVIAIYGGVDNLNILPVDFDVFVSEFIGFFLLIFNFRNYIDYFIYLLPTLSLISRILILCLPLFYLIYKFFDSYFDLHNFEKVEKTKQLKRYLKLKNKIILPTYAFIKKNIILFYNSKYFKITILLLMALFNFYSIIIDFVGWYFYFLATWSIVDTYNLVVVNLIDLAPLLLSIPRIVYITVAYIIFDKIRVSSAKKKLEHFLRYIFGFIKTSLGVFTRIHGGPGSGKTLLMTDMHDASEEMLRNDADDIMYEVSTQFFDFPYLNLERAIDKERELGNLKNHYQVKSYMNYVFYEYSKDRRKENLFDYEITNFEFNNGIYTENLFDCLIQYAQAYFVYSSNCPLSAANYSIRHDGKMITQGYSKEWVYNTLFADPISVKYSHYCKIVNFDYLRAFKKIDSKNQSYMYDACVLSFTEIDKERGNQFLHHSLKFEDALANQLNDGFNSYLKLGRHDSTIRYRLFFKGFFDTQRAGSVNADLNEICETAITILPDEEGFKSSLFMWWIEPFICESYLSWYRKINKKYKFNRAVNTLLIYLIRSVANKLFAYYIRRHMQYDFKILNLEVDNGIGKRQQQYPLMKCRAFRIKYASDCYSGYFEEPYLNSDKSFEELNSYMDIYPTSDEFNQQQSYMIDDFNKKITSTTISIEDNNITNNEIDDDTYY